MTQPTKLVKQHLISSERERKKEYDERSQLPVCATTILIPLVAYTALTSALFPNAARPSALLLQLLMTFLSAMTIAFCNLDLAQTEWLCIIDQKIEVGNVLRCHYP